MCFHCDHASPRDGFLKNDLLHIFHLEGATLHRPPHADNGRPVTASPSLGLLSASVRTPSILFRITTT